MIQKEKNPKNHAVKVTFKLPKDGAEARVAVVGDFNGWNETRDLMKRNKQNGQWARTIALVPGREVQFRYLIDGTPYSDDEQADRLVANVFGTENGVLVV